MDCLYLDIAKLIFPILQKRLKLLFLGCTVIRAAAIHVAVAKPAKGIAALV
jgi:hypothetical protein